MLADIAPLAHRIDTSDLSAAGPADVDPRPDRQDRSRITLLFESFGFKHGHSARRRLVFDVRCLPNRTMSPSCARSPAAISR